MKHILPTDLVNKVLTYMAARPYSEVALLIADIKAQAVQYVEPESAPIHQHECVTSEIAQ